MFSFAASFSSWRQIQKKLRFQSESSINSMHFSFACCLCVKHSLEKQASERPTHSTHSTGINASTHTQLLSVDALLFLTFLSVCVCVTFFAPTNE